jgi:hypothetical protein
MSKLSLVDTILGIGLFYMTSAFGIFLLRQTFKTIPRELEEAARVESCSWLGVLWRVYVHLARHTYLAYARLRELPLEQLALAAGGDQLRAYAPSPWASPSSARRSRASTGP